MTKKTSALKARQNLGRIMDEVALGGDDYIIERSGRPLVAIVAIEKYQKIKANQRSALRSLGEIWGKMKHEESDLIENTIEEALIKTKRI